MARREAVLQRQRRAGHRERLREELFRYVLRRVAHQQVAGEPQHLRVLALGLLAPALERGERGDPGGHALEVERGDRLVADQHVLPPRLVLEQGDLGDELPVVREERAARGERPRHQRLADEDVARRRRVDGAVGHAPPRHQRQAVERDALARDHLAARGVPLGLEVIAGDPVAGDRLHPFRLDPRRAARVEPRGLGQLGGEDPLAALAREPGAGVEPEADPARALVRVAFLRAHADVAEQAGEQALVDRRVTRGVDRRRELRRPLEAEVGDPGGELRVDVAPFGEPQIRDELRAAGIDQPAMRQPLGELRVEELPQRDERQEIRALVAKAQVRLVGRLRPLERALARIGHRQRAGDDQHLGEAAALARGEDHSPDARVDRQAREVAAERGERARGVHGAQLLQHLIAVGDGARAGRFEEGERLDRAEIERGHPQDHRGERRAQDLGLGVGGPRGELLLGIQAHADPGRHAAAAPRALLRRRLRNALDLQQRGLVAHRVALDSREPGIDHVADSRHGQRGLGDVGREHDAAAAAAREHPLLLRDGQPRVERQDLDVARVGPLREAAAQELRGLADLALAGQEHEDVAGAFAPEVLGRGDDGVLELLLVVGLLLAGRERPVAHLDGVHAPRNLDHRRGSRLAVDHGREVAREALGIECGRGHDHLQVRPFRQQLLQEAQQEVDVEAALVRLVDDERVVGREPPVALGLGEQDAVGHQLDERVGLRVVGEAHLVADGLARRRAELLRDPRGHRARGDAPRLRVTDQPPLAAAFREADLRELRGLAGSGLAADDDDLIRPDRRADFRGTLRHRQVRRIGDGGAAGGALAPPRHRALDRLRQPLPFGGRGPPAARAVEPAPEGGGVGAHRVGEIGEQSGVGRVNCHGDGSARILRSPQGMPPVAPPVTPALGPAP
jgi:hypothetical protein